MKTKYLLLSTFLLSVVIAANSQNTNHGTGAGNSGSENTSLGYYAGDLVTGTLNVFIGHHSGKSNTIGWLNSFVGARAGYSNTSGAGNSFFGYEAGYSNTTGGLNSFFGRSSGDANTTGTQNSFFGGGSGRQNTTGSENAYFGYGAGSDNSSGSYNTCLGTWAGRNNLTGIKNVFIGHRAGYNELNSNKLYIENSDSPLPLIYGDFATDKVGINSLPNTTHTLTVGGTIHSTGLYVNGVLVSGDLSLWDRVGSNVYTQSTSDNIGIGTTLANNPNNYKLAVNGKIGAKEVQIENTSLTWPDFVFKADYKLMTLSEVEAFIKANGHLPEVPSEEQVAKEGIKVSELNAKLLQKIEELTLYVIELRKEVDALKNGKE